MNQLSPTPRWVCGAVAGDQKESRSELRLLAGNIYTWWGHWDRSFPWYSQGKTDFPREFTLPGYEDQAGSVASSVGELG